jgi:cullin 1
MDQRRIIDFDEGWERIQIGITKLISIVEGSPNNKFSSEEYMMLYTYPFIIEFS